ncbi:MAG: hypothetical protein HOP18_05530 [Deltaproteobacteria bacterium]|nr:hypothetical protein [Deltaproteobacteria bacterium]
MIFSFISSLLLALLLFQATAYAADFAVTSRLGISQDALRKGLEKIGGPVTFTPRPGSTQGTQEARLPDNAGLVQAGGNMGNLTTIVLWLPVDAKGNLVSMKARTYLEAVVANFVSERERIVLWVDEVLKRALAEVRSTPYLESQLVEKYQFKATYIPTLHPQMVSLAITASSDE